MAKKDTQINFGEISTIRDILMGPTISGFEKKFEEMEGTIKKLEKELNDKMVQMHDNHQNHHGEFSNTITNRFEKLEALISNNVKNLEDKLESVSQQDKERLAALMVEFSKKLVAGK